MNKKGSSDFGKIAGIILFFITMGVFISEEIFSTIISSFSESLGGWGVLFGSLLILTIIIGLLQKILEK